VTLRVWEVLEGGVAAVGPVHQVVDVEPVGRGVASGAHTRPVPGLDRAPQVRWRTVRPLVGRLERLGRTGKAGHAPGVAADTMSESASRATEMAQKLVLGGISGDEAVSRLLGSHTDSDALREAAAFGAACWQRIPGRPDAPAPPSRCR